MEFGSVNNTFFEGAFLGSLTIWKNPKRGK